MKAPFQTERLALYHEHVERLLREDKAYRCYCTRDELDAMRTAQRARGEKPRYDGRCRHRTGPPPASVEPVVRFKNPVDGTVAFDDLVRGPVAFDNRELDDLVIARGNEMPTYNFGVVVDDLDMDITHVIRGDDHVMNTPRQMNFIAALDAPPPRYADVPMILGADGQRLAKRHGAVGGDAASRRRVPAGGVAQPARAARLVVRRPGDLRAHGDDRAVRHRQRFALRKNKAAVAPSPCALLP